VPVVVDDVEEEQFVEGDLTLAAYIRDLERVC